MNDVIFEKFECIVGHLPIYTKLYYETPPSQPWR